MFTDRTSPRQVVRADITEVISSCHEMWLVVYMLREYKKDFRLMLILTYSVAMQYLLI